jgi:hypothetical protein
LNSTWKAEVNQASYEWIPIRKNNLLAYYSRAREKAFTKTTIKGAFRKTGIWPFNRNAIEHDAFAPALNTTTQAAPPVPTTLPDLLIPEPNSTTPSATPSTVPSIVPSTTPPTTPDSTPIASAATSQSNGDASEADVEVKYIMANFPAQLPIRASRDALLAQNAELRYLLDRSCIQMQRDYALRKLMDKENGRLRKRLYDKAHKPKKKLTSGLSRHMTSEETLDALARDEWASAMKEVFKEGVFKARRDAYEKHCRDLAAAEKAREKAAEKRRKEAERNETQRRKEIEKIRSQEERK